MPFSPDHRPFRPVTAAAILVLLSAAAQSAHAASATGQIAVTIAGLNSNDGQLGCALFESESGFPGNPAAARIKEFHAIADKKASCLFNNLPAGHYAVSVFHDRNMNGKLDTNMFGAPTEGYGVSNNHTHALSAPKWAESMFDLNAGEAKAITIELRY